MKKFIATIVLIVLLFSLTACGKGETGTMPDEVTTQEIISNDENSSANDEFDSIDNANDLKMKMYGDYYCSQSGSVHRFFDGKVVVSYTHLYESTAVKEPKDINAYLEYIPSLLKPRIFINEDDIKLSFVKESLVNNFKVKEFNGTISDNKKTTHNCRVYTFVCGDRDCIVIAAPIENTDEMIEKMNKDIDIFMNNLEVDK